MPAITTHRRLVLAALLSTLTLGVAPMALGQVVTMKYVVTDLGNLKGVAGSSVIAIGLNEAGQVVGQSETASGDTHAFRTAPNRVIKPVDDLGTLGGPFSAAYAINNLGQVVGDADLAPDANSVVVRRAFRLDPGSPMVDLGTLVPSGTVMAFNSSGARSINDAGIVVGYARVPLDACGSVSHAFRTAPNAPIAPLGGNDLGTLVPPPYTNCRSSIAWGVNSAGVAVGNSATVVSSGTPNHAFRTAPFVYRIDLNNFGWGNSTAFAVNDLGETVGEAQVVNTDPFVSPHAFISEGQITHRTIDIGTLGGSSSSATAINYRYPNDSQVVGVAATTNNAALHAFLWTGNVFNGGTMVDLNSRIDASAGWELTRARAINNKGQIVSDARRAGAPFVYYAVRLDPSDAAVGIVIASLSDPSYALSGGQINALTDKLTNALQSIRQGFFKQAINQLNAAIGSIQVAVSNGKMSGATAQALTAAINAIIPTLS